MTDEANGAANEATFMSALVTEHFVLQSAASTTVSEAAGPASLFTFTLSSSLVALGFVAQSETLTRSKKSSRVTTGSMSDLSRHAGEAAPVVRAVQLVHRPDPVPRSSAGTSVYQGSGR
jgi:hypothetical protein